MNLVPNPEPIKLTAQPPTEAAMPPNRPPAPIRVDEDALRRVLQVVMLPALSHFARLADAAERSARALEEYNRRAR